MSSEEEPREPSSPPRWAYVLVAALIALFVFGYFISPGATSL